MPIAFKPNNWALPKEHAMIQVNVAGGVRKMGIKVLVSLLGVLIAAEPVFPADFPSKEEDP